MKTTYSSMRKPMMGVLLGLSMSISAHSQEGRTSDLEPGTRQPSISREIGREGETAFSEHDRNSVITTPKTETLKDSASVSIVKPTVVAPTNSTTNNNTTNTKAARPPEGRNQKEEDPSVLSFNFLYYIIQRYKLSDIVD